MLRLFLLVLLTTSTAYAGEAEVRERLLKEHPQIGQVDQVNKAPIPGLYEVVTPDRLFYTDEQAQYLIDGALWELSTMRNVTAERARKLFAVEFAKLPFDLTMKRVKGDGKRQMFVITDPNCGYCKRLETELQKIDNVTIYRLMFPIFQGSDQKVRNVWCSKDRNKAWEDLMLRGIAPAAASKCEYPATKALEWGRKLRVTGTPALIFADGVLVPGALPAEELEKALSGQPVQ